MNDDEQLTLYFYADGLDATTRASIRARLETDVEFARRYETLRGELRALSAPAPVAAPAFNAALHETLIAAAAPPARARWPQWALAASVVLGVALIASLWRAPAPPPRVTDVTPPAPGAPVPSQRTVRLVQTHLAQSQLQLVRYQQADRSTRQTLIDDLLAQNRVIENAAERSGNDDLARVLRAFEPVLERLAHGDRAGLDDEHLLDQLQFELGAMLTKLDAPASDSSITF